MRLCTILSAALLFAVSTGFACECEGKRPSKGEKAENGGKHEKGEIIKRFDADGDGKLNEGERAAARAAFEAKKTEMQDKRDEHLAQMKTKHPDLFAKLDANGDGNLDEAERKAAREQFRQKHPDGEGRPQRDGDAAGKDRPKREHDDNGRRAKGDPNDNGHDHGRRGKDGE